MINLEFLLDRFIDYLIQEKEKRKKTKKKYQRKLKRKREIKATNFHSLLESFGCLFVDDMISHHHHLRCHNQMS